MGPAEAVVAAVSVWSPARAAQAEAAARIGEAMAAPEEISAR
jgi:hypothetical protein